MQRLTLFVGLLAVVLLLAPSSAQATDKPTYEALIKDWLKTITDMNEVLRNIKDDQTARATLPKLEKIVERRMDTLHALKYSGDPSQDERERVSKEFDPGFDRANEDLRRELRRLSSLRTADQIVKLVYKE